MDYSRDLQGKQPAVRVARDLGQRLEDFVHLLLIHLDRHIDKRLVWTSLSTLQVIVRFRQGTQGLLLSKIGGYLVSPDRAPAGTNRLSNQLRSQKWTWRLIARFLWQEAAAALNDLEAAGESALLAWGESVLEKSESIARWMHDGYLRSLDARAAHSCLASAVPGQGHGPDFHIDKTGKTK